VRDNGRLSKSAETRDEVARFDADEGHNLRVLQKQLAAGKFKFAPQKGVAKKKPNSNKRRPLVLAPVENRVVQRAILEVLQAKVPKVREVLDTPTSIGGVPKRANTRVRSKYSLILARSVI
jgi:retron-type reverse transcriptase